MKFGLIGDAYESQSPNADAQSLMNLYRERIESGDGNNQSVLYSTPGKKLFVDLSGLAVRGEITINGRSFAVCDGTFYEMTVVGGAGTKTNRGAVSNDSQTVSMVASQLEILIASGGTAYVFDLGTNVLTALPGTDFDGEPVIQVDYAEGFFLALRDDSVWQVSAPLDATSWDLTQVAEVSVFPDKVIAMKVVNNQPWFMSATKGVPYYLSGNIFPFDAITNAVMEQGTAAKDSLALLDNTLFWLGSDSRGTKMVWRANGYLPLRISDHAMEYALSTYSRVDDAIGYAYQDQGHGFYVLYFPTASATWVYDVATGKWHRRGFWDTTNSAFIADRARCHTYNATFDKHLVGDWKTGKVYEQRIPTYNGGVWDFATDDGALIRRVRRSPHVSNEQKWMFHSQLQVYLETGLGPIPPLPGNEPPTLYSLADKNGIIWFIGLDDSGILSSTLGYGSGQTIFLNDNDTNTTSWQLTVDTIGTLLTTKVAYKSSYPQILSTVSDSGTKRWGIQVDVNGILATTFIESVSRAPQVVVSWSDDGGHTFKNVHIVDAGKAGEYKARVNVRRCGKSRDRVYQFEWSDPIPWRVTDGYLEASGG